MKPVEEIAEQISEIGNLHMEWGDNVASEVAEVLRRDRAEQREEICMLAASEIGPGVAKILRDAIRARGED